MEEVLSGAYVATFQPEHQLCASEDRDGHGQRLHIVVQPILTDQHIVRYYVEFHRIVHGLRTSVTEGLRKLVHMSTQILHRESAALILAVSIERGSCRLLAVLIIQKQEYAGINRTGCTSADTCICRHVRVAYRGTYTGQEHAHRIHHGHVLKAQRDIGLKHEALVDFPAVLHSERAGDGLSVKETV